MQNKSQSLDSFLIGLNKTLSDIERTINNIDDTYKVIFKFTDNKIAYSKKLLLAQTTDLRPKKEIKALDEISILLGKIIAFNLVLLNTFPENIKFQPLVAHYSKLQEKVTVLSSYAEKIRENNKNSNSQAVVTLKENTELRKQSIDHEHIHSILVERNELRKDLDNNQEKCSELTHQKESLREKLTVTTCKLNRSNQENSTLKNELKDVKSNLQKKETEYKILERDYNKIFKELQNERSRNSTTPPTPTKQKSINNNLYSTFSSSSYESRFSTTGVPREMRQSLTTHPDNHY